MKIGVNGFFLLHKTTNHSKTNTMEQTNTPSTKGKGLGVAGMVIGIVALVWAIIPVIGAAAWWLALVGLILSVVAFFMAKSGGNPNKGMIIVGLILNFVALALAFYWVYSIMQAAKELGTDMDELNKALQDMSDSLNNAGH